MSSELIEEGKGLTVKEIDVMGIKKQRYEGVEFERWASKTALFFENQSESTVKDKVLHRYAKLNKDNSKEFYELALGSLQAIEEQ